MPDVLMEFLAKLNDKDADALHLWLDETPDAVVEMKCRIEDTHPDLPLL
jgi:hypothetical protein